MKSKILLLLVVLAVASPLSAAPRVARPSVVIVVDYGPEVPSGRQHLFFSVCDYFRYFAPWLCPCAF